MLAEPRVYERDVGHDGQNDREANQRRASQVETRYNPRQVHREDTKKYRGQQGKKASAIFSTEKIFGDVNPNQVETHFNEALEATGHNLHASSTKPEEKNQQCRHEEPDQDDAVDFEGSICKKNGGRKKLADRGTDESTLRGRLGEQSESVT